MKLFTQSFRKIVLGGVVAGMLLSTGTLYSQAAKSWKDTAEYELYTQYTKATAPDQQIQLLNQWKEKYPESDYKLERAQAYLVIYSKKNDAAGLYAACKDLLAVDPKSFQALYYLTLLTVSLNKNDAAGFDTGIKAANGLIGALDATYDPAKKPAGTTDAQWKQQRNDIETQALKTLGWVEWQRSVPSSGLSLSCRRIPSGKLKPCGTLPGLETSMVRARCPPPIELRWQVTLHDPTRHTRVTIRKK